MRRFLLSALLAIPATTAGAVDIRSELEAFLRSDISTWAGDPVIVGAVTAQNARTAGLSEAEILDLDQVWRNEVGTAARPTIDSVLHNAAADFLRDQVGRSNGLITEVFVVDRVGLNVAASDITSDYWQGDEAKYQQTFPMGPGAVHVSEVEFDESSQAYQAQVSITLTDPDSGDPIGAMTVGINAESLM